MGLLQLLLQELLRGRVVGREGFRDLLEHGLRVALPRLHGEYRLVELRVAREVARVGHVLVLLQGREERVDYRVVRVRYLDPDRILSLLEEAQLHWSRLTTNRDLSFCGLRRNTRDQGERLRRSRSSAATPTTTTTPTPPRRKRTVESGPGPAPASTTVIWPRMAPEWYAQ